MKKSSSKRWLNEHFSDPYVKRAKREGFRARSAYKLIEINQRYHLIKKGMVVVDLGASPGGWSEYIALLLENTGKIFALDLIPIKPIKGVEFIQGDFTTREIVNYLYNTLGGAKVDLVLSDMAPNLSGVKTVDQMRSVNLAECAFNFAIKVLKPGGSFLVKIFHGEGFEEFIQSLKKSFTEVKIIKPDASRSRSSEVFVLANSMR